MNDLTDLDRQVAKQPIACQWIGCTQPATIRIVRASTNLCKDHYAENILRFGCEFEVKEITTEAPEVKHD